MEVCRPGPGRSACPRPADFGLAAPSDLAKRVVELIESARLQVGSTPM
jgi:hypothetical protein